MAILETALSEPYKQCKEYKNVSYSLHLLESKSAFNSYDGENSLERSLPYKMALKPDRDSLRSSQDWQKPTEWVGEGRRGNAATD